MPVTISGGNPPLFQARNTASSRVASAQVRFGGDSDTVHLQASSSTAPVQAPESKGWQIKERLSESLKGLTDGLKPGRMLKDLLLSTVVTIPLCILPGSQLFLIPTYVAARTVYYSLKGAVNGLRLKRDQE